MSHSAWSAHVVPYASTMAAKGRNVICGRYIVAAIEHLDGTASIARMPSSGNAPTATDAAATDGGLLRFAGMGDAGPPRWAMLRHRVEEVSLAVDIFHALAEGKLPQGLAHGLQPPRAPKCAAFPPGQIRCMQPCVRPRRTRPPRRTAIVRCVRALQYVRMPNRLRLRQPDGSQRAFGTVNGASPPLHACRPAAVPPCLSSFLGRIDSARIAVVGHSWGGATSIAAGASDPRLCAAVAFDPWHAALAPSLVRLCLRASCTSST